MYSINGVALTNSTYGWRLIGSSNIVPDYSVQNVSLNVPGRPGVLTTAQQPMDASPVVLKIQTPGANRERLVALMSQPSLILAKVSDPTRQVALELVTIANENFNAAERLLEISFVLRANDVYWRDVSVSTDAAVSITSTPQALNSVMSGITAPVNDYLIRVGGSITGLRVTDSAGDYFEYLPNIPSGSYIIFDCATGKASVVATNVWTGGTPVLATIGSATRIMQLTPVYGATFFANLTVVSTARSGATLEVRGKRAFA
jgi:hypothetical protein